MSPLSTMDKVTPGFFPPPAVPTVAAKELAVQLNRAKAALDAHKAARPANQDIQALTIWAQEKSLLEGRLELLEAQVKVAWKDVPVPSAAPAQLAPSIRPFAQFTPEAPMPRVAKPPQDQLQHLVNGLNEQIKKLDSANTQEAWLSIRQAAYWKRAEINKFAKKHHLTAPAAPVFPVDPWSTRKGRATQAAAPPQLVSMELGCVTDFTDLASLAHHAPSGSPQERLATLGLALRYLQSSNPLAPAGLLELLGILADFAGQGGGAA